MTLKSGSPTYIYKRLSSVYSYKTRQCTTGNIRQDETFSSSSSLPRNSFRNRGALDYNKVPVSNRAISNITTFKVKLRQWVKLNIDLEYNREALIFLSLTIQLE